MIKLSCLARDLISQSVSKLVFETDSETNFSLIAYQKKNMLTKFAAGQVWKYNTRSHESDSRVIVVRVDSDDQEFGNIIHIYVSGVDIPNAEAPGGKTVFIQHMPYEEDSLEQSVTELESDTKDLPDYSDGYKLWKDAFEKGEAGVFTVSVSEAVDFVQQSIG